MDHVTRCVDPWFLILLDDIICKWRNVHHSIYNIESKRKEQQMNMNDFHAWVKAGNFDKPRQADDSYTSRLQEHNKDVLRTIEKISGQRTSPERSQLQEKMTGPDGRFIRPTR